MTVSPTATVAGEDPEPPFGAAAAAEVEQLHRAATEVRVLHRLLHVGGRGHAVNVLCRVAERQVHGHHRAGGRPGEPRDIVQGAGLGLGLA